jgi:hypothetical protein
LPVIEDIRRLIVYLTARLQDNDARELEYSERPVCFVGKIMACVVDGMPPFLKREKLVDADADLSGETKGKKVCFSASLVALRDIVSSCSKLRLRLPNVRCC